MVGFSLFEGRQIGLLLLVLLPNFAANFKKR